MLWPILLLALSLVGAESAGAATITSWIGGKGSVPAIVTAGGGACPGTLVTITGSGFVSDGGVKSVTIGGAPASQIIVGMDTRMYARVGTGATSGPLTVTTTKGTVTASLKADVVPCQVTGLATDAPVINTLTPKARAGKKFRMLGSGFIGTTSVKVNGVATAYAIPSDGLMYVIMPAGAKVGLATIVVTTNKGSVKAITVNAASS